MTHLVTRITRHRIDPSCRWATADPGHVCVDRDGAPLELSEAKLCWSEARAAEIDAQRAKLDVDEVFAAAALDESIDYDDHRAEILAAHAAAEAEAQAVIDAHPECARCHAAGPPHGPCSDHGVIHCTADTGCW